MLGSSGLHEKFTGTQPDCHDGEYSARTLQLAYELPFPGIFRDTKGQKKYEASDIILVRNPKNYGAMLDTIPTIPIFSHTVTCNHIYIHVPFLGGWDSLCRLRQQLGNLQVW